MFSRLKKKKRYEKQKLGITVICKCDLKPGNKKTLFIKL